MSGDKSIPVIVQSENVFSAGFILTESNYDIWSQLMDMHIIKREKLSYINDKMKKLEKPTMAMKNGMLRIKK